MDEQPKRSGLLQLLRESAGSQFVIPVYQRNYTWSAGKEVKQYLDDLKSVILGDYKNHFMGIIIYLQRSIDFSSRELSIIDGQQRLTTTFLLLYAIRSFLSKNGDAAQVQQLDGQYLTNPYHVEKIKYKLKPLVADDDVYRCIVENRMNDITDTDSNVLKNYQYIEGYLNRLFLDGYDANAVLMALDRLYVVCVPISENDNAQKIFESINATGVKLTSADLIRNYLLMDLQSDIQEDYYKRYWKKIEDNVSSASQNLELFFRMYLAIKKFELTAKNNVYREFVQWKKEQDLETKELFEDLLKYAKIFNALINEDLSHIDGKLRAALEDFRKIKSDMPTPIMMEFYNLYMQGLISVDVLNELFWSINSYVIRRSLCDINSQNISKLFPTVLKKVLEECNGNYDNIVKFLNREMVGNTAGTSGSYMPTDRQMMEFLYSANVYKRPALRIVFDRIELYQNPAPVDLTTLSIEHLMPQTPTEEWLEELDTDAETYLEYLHRIGNLTLASKPDNSRMGNLNWKYKNEILKDTAHLTLNIDLMPIEKWNLAKIDERSKSLIEKICKIYPCPDIDMIKDNEDDIISETDTLDICVKMGITESDVKSVRLRRVYKAKDNSVGYVIASSKMYPQGDKEKYWFGYREKRFEDISECEQQYLILACRSRDVFGLKIPRSFILGRLDNLNISVDDDGNITHYHIVIFRNSDGKITMLLSKPSVTEIDVSRYLITLS